MLLHIFKKSISIFFDFFENIKNKNKNKNKNKKGVKPPFYFNYFN
jgi:hypothetical protein